MSFRPAFCAALLITLAACAATPQLATGSWQLKTPEGKAATAEISHVGRQQYQLSIPNNPASGTYDIDSQGQLHMLKPDAPNMEGFVWIVQDDGALRLVAEPPYTVTGTHQYSALLRKKP